MPAIPLRSRLCRVYWICFPSFIADIGGARPPTCGARLLIMPAAPSRKASTLCLWLGVLCLWWAALFSSTARAADILLVAGEDTAGVQSFTQALRALRPDDTVRFLPLANLTPPGQLNPATRLILLDLPSLEWRVQDSAGPSALVLRISRLQARQRLGVNVPPYLSLLWSDPAPHRQLNLIQTLMPQVRRVGVLYDRHSEFLLSELRLAALSLNLEIVAEPWENTQDSQPLKKLLDRSDVLLGVDDPDLFNPKTAKNLLLSSYARQRALIGPNAGFVKAGSLASTYSDQDDWLAILDELLDQPPATWPRTQYPRRFKVTSNLQVSRSLGLEPVNDATVATLLAEGERHP